MNIYEKLLEIKKTVEYLKKENAGVQYNFVSSSQVIGAIRNKMNELQVLLVPQVESANFTDIARGTNSKGKETVDILTELLMCFQWVNVENPAEVISVKWYGQGYDTNGEKGVGKAYTYAEKYFLLKFFNIPTDKDDPDAFQEKSESKINKKTKSNNTEKTEKEEIDDFEILSNVNNLNTFAGISNYFNSYNKVVSNKSAFLKAINNRRKQLSGGE